ncbi:unnamed protein product [Amoebophrya sp. A25]|nr:unnamed protein product [Amoebophrya sp. A25]|eukprot:GSA25T00014498001.1
MIRTSSGAIKSANLDAALSEHTSEEEMTNLDPALRERYRNMLLLQQRDLQESATSNANGMNEKTGNIKQSSASSSSARPTTGSAGAGQLPKRGGLVGSSGVIQGQGGAGNGKTTSIGAAASTLSGGAATAPGSSASATNKSGAQSRSLSTSAGTRTTGVLQKHDDINTAGAASVSENDMESPKNCNNSAQLDNMKRLVKVLVQRLVVSERARAELQQQLEESGVIGSGEAGGSNKCKEPAQSGSKLADEYLDQLTAMIDDFGEELTEFRHHRQEPNGNANGNASRQRTELSTQKNTNSNTISRSS